MKQKLVVVVNSKDDANLIEAFFTSLNFKEVTYIESIAPIENEKGVIKEFATKQYVTALENMGYQVTLKPKKIFAPALTWTSATNITHRLQDMDLAYQGNVQKWLKSHGFEEAADLVGYAYHYHRKPSLYMDRFEAALNKYATNPDLCSLRVVQIYAP